MDLPTKPGEGKKEVIALEKLSDDEFGNLADDVFGDGKDTSCNEPPRCPHCGELI